MLTVTPPSWTHPMARKHDLTHVLLRMPRGFKSEDARSSGVTHIIEHLIVTGIRSDSVHFNGFTSDSTTVVYALCHASRREEVVEELAHRLDPRTITRRRLDEEVAAIHAETRGRRPVPRRVSRALSGLGFNPDDGRPSSPTSLDAVIERAEVMCDVAQIWVFEPGSSQPRLVVGSSEPLARGALNRHWRREDACGVTVGQTFAPDALDPEQRRELATILSLAAAYLTSRGGYAMAGYLDDWSLWAGEHWIVTHVPSHVSQAVRANTDGTLAGLAQRVASASPVATGAVERQIRGGPGWIHHPVVRQMVSATAPDGSAHRAQARTDSRSPHLRSASAFRIV